MDLRNLFSKISFDRTKEQATKLINLLKNQLAHVNLISYNENPAIDLKESEEKTIIEFKNILENIQLQKKY